MTILRSVETVKVKTSSRTSQGHGKIWLTQKCRGIADPVNGFRRCSHSHQPQEVGGRISLRKLIYLLPFLCIADQCVEGTSSRNLWHRLQTT